MTEVGGSSDLSIVSFSGSLGSNITGTMTDSSLTSINVTYSEL